MGAENAPLSYRCSRCGNTFKVNPDGANICPICGFNCGPDKCRQVDASDEGY
ncbi:MAG: hypothetical protein IMW95_05435 [Moorella humiferrea]|nr:hypothetical protein [Moorella humiferrea]